jgi:hypothetical protein
VGEVVAVPEEPPVALGSSVLEVVIADVPATLSFIVAGSDSPLLPQATAVSASAIEKSLLPMVVLLLSILFPKFQRSCVLC